MGGFPQIDALVYNFLAWAFAAAALAVEWFFIAALSAAMEKMLSSEFSAPLEKRAVISYYAPTRIAKLGPSAERLCHN